MARGKRYLSTLILDGRVKKELPEAKPEKKTRSKDTACSKASANKFGEAFGISTLSAKRGETYDEWQYKNMARLADEARQRMDSRIQSALRFIV